MTAMLAALLVLVMVALVAFSAIGTETHRAAHQARPATTERGSG